MSELKTDELTFVDWHWHSYIVLKGSPKLKRRQERLLLGTGLCEGKDGLEYSFVPTKTMGQLEARLLQLYQELPVNQTALTQEVFNSSKIEGADITLQRAQQLQNGAEIDYSNFFSESMILGGFKAAEFLDSVSNQLTLTSLLEAWRVLTNNACDNESIKGTRFRTGYVAVGNHVGLNPDLIEEAMKNWVDYYNGNTLAEHPFIKAALLHFAFEFIHPFCDGNERTGRLLMNNFLIKEGLEKVRAVSFSQSIEKDREEYYKALADGDNPQTDCTSFIEYVLQTFVDAFFDVWQ